jgi:MtN3 and saliva related transmembrane protein
MLKDNMDTVTKIGILAGICTTVAVIPQIVRTWKTKKVMDVSISMFIVLITGVGLWTLYGVLKKDLPIIITNGISVVLNLCMLYFIISYSAKSN